MSLTFLSANALTTNADLRRKPALDRGQLARTLIFFFCGAATLALVARHAPPIVGDHAPVIAEVTDAR